MKQLKPLLGLISCVLVVSSNGWLARAATISPELEFDVPVSVLAPYEQDRAAAACNGTNFLVVWEDNRRGETLNANRGDIYAARVGLDGTLLNGRAFPIATNVVMDRHPAVASNGRDYLVVWQTLSGSSFAIAAARVSSEGEVSAPTNLVTTPLSVQATRPAVASNGDDYLVAWTTDITRAISITRVTGSGTLSNYNRTTLAAGVTPKVAAHGGDYLVVFDDAANIHGVRVTAAGPEPRFAISAATGDQTFPSVAGYSGGYFVGWGDTRNAATTGSDVYGARVSATGTLLDPAGLSLQARPGSQARPAIAVAGDTLCLAWNEPTRVFAARITSAGVPLDSPLELTATAPGAEPAIAGGANLFLAAWNDERFYSPSTLNEIFAARLTDTGQLLDPNDILLTVSLNAQFAPALAFNGTNYLAAWIDNRFLNAGDGSVGPIYAARLSADGAMLDNASFAVGPATFKRLPSIAAGADGNFLMVWEDQRNSGSTGSDIYGVRISSAGLVLETNSIAINQAPGAQTSPRVAWHGTGWWVLWQNAPNHIAGARVRPDGSVIDLGTPFEPHGITIHLATNSLQSATLISHPDSVLAVWSEIVTGQLLETHVRGKRLSATGVLDSSPLTICNHPANKTQLAGAAHAGRVLVTWEDARNTGVTGVDLYGTFVTSNGVPLTPAGAVISAGPANQTRPAVVWDGKHFLVVWTDDRSAATLGQDLYGAYVLTNTPLLEFPVSRIPGDHILPALAPALPFGALVAFQGPRYDLARTLGHFLWETPEPRIDSISWDEGTGIISWYAYAGHQYQLQRSASASLSSPLQWQNAGTPVVGADAETNKVNVSITPTRFYRLQRLP